MIEGLRYEILGKILYEHMQRRAAHHLERRKFHENLLVTDEDLTNWVLTHRSGFSSVTAAEPYYREIVKNEKETAKHNILQWRAEKQRDHGRLAERFSKLSLMLVPDEMYRLTEIELSSLEFLS